MNVDVAENLETQVIDHEIVESHDAVLLEKNLVVNQKVSSSILRVLGNVIITDHVDKCNIESTGGSVFLMYGPSSNLTTITAKKNIYVKYALQSTLTAGDSIIIEQSIMRSRLKARNSIVNEMENGNIVGGEIIVGNRLEVDVLGSHAEIETSVTVESPTGMIACKHIFPGVSITIGEKTYYFSKEFQGAKIYLKDGAFVFD